jgi:hypothetical protein
MPIDIVVGNDRIRTSVSAPSFGISATVPGTSGTGLEYIPVTLEGPGAFQVTRFALRPQDEDAAEPTIGFFAPERDEIGEFRWVGPRGDIVITRSGPPVRLRLRGRVPVEFVTMPLELDIEVAGQLVKTEMVRTAEFNLTVDLPAAPRGSSTLVSVEASSSFVPDTIERNGDNRVLTFRAYELHAERVGGGSGSGAVLTETVLRATREPLSAVAR